MPILAGLRGARRSRAEGRLGMTAHHEVIPLRGKGRRLGHITGLAAGHPQPWARQARAHLRFEL
jgi:hypothetical protein